MKKKRRGMKKKTTWFLSFSWVPERQSKAALMDKTLSLFWKLFWELLSFHTSPAFMFLCVLVTFFKYIYIYIYIHTSRFFIFIRKIISVLLINRKTNF